ncbi:MAG: deaminase [Microbacterium sp.]
MSDRSKVVIEMSMSLDGFVATPEHSTEHVHAWYDGGDVAVQMPHSDLTFHVDEVSAPIVRAAFELGANVTGRVTFDDAEAWGGQDPMGIPSFIVTHEVPEEWRDRESPFTFVTDGVQSAIRQAKAAAIGDRPVGVAGGDIAMQCLRLGLLDELWIHDSRTARSRHPPVRRARRITGSARAAAGRRGDRRHAPLLRRDRTG